MQSLFGSTSPDDILGKIGLRESHFDWRFVPDYKVLKIVTDRLKQDNKRVVLTQGVYDLVHEGHAQYLEKARSYGDILVVGVDSDELTRRRKGPNRPIVPQHERVRMLTHLRHVDLVTIKDINHDIGELIRVIRPDILIVSDSTKDFTSQMAKEYKDVCKEVISLPPQATTTTSARIRSLSVEGAQKLSEEINKVVNNFLGTLKDGE